ncbi:MAG: hypothetical protein NC180_00450 [Muribaculaceae bacterium]|nr:hypothetical protein [Roseburia sp.]MCM1431644.1 hypothetical protein [Muribaculaceae bacterium]MCM1491684.1 hypothetical protein [Muribaculaceae bacterium]
MEDGFGVAGLNAYGHGMAENARGTMEWQRIATGSDGSPVIAEGVMPCRFLRKEAHDCLAGDTCRGRRCEAPANRSGNMGYSPVFYTKAGVFYCGEARGKGEL